MTNKNSKQDINQYDAFLRNVQRTKVKELWDNEADEEWDRS